MSELIGRPSTTPRTPSPNPRDRRPKTMGWRTPDVARAAAIVLGMYAGALLLWEARVLALLTFLGILFGLAVSSVVDQLAKLRIPRGVGAALVVFGTIASIVGVLAWSAPTLRSQSAELREKFPQAIERLDRWFYNHRSGVFGSLISASGAADSTLRPGARAPGVQDTIVVAIADSSKSGGSAIGKQIASRMGGATKFLFPFVTSTVTALGAVLFLVFLAIYVGAEPDLYRVGLLHLFPTRRRKRAEEVVAAISNVLRRWLVTQLIAMLAIGVVTTIALLILRIPAALPLGIIAGFLEFIPTLGPVLSAIPAVVMGFVDSPEKAGLVAVVYLGIQLLENHILIPLLMKEGVDLPPALTILAQALMAILFGFIGLLVAVPALAVVVVTVKMLYVEDDPDDAVDVAETGEATEASA